MANWPQIEEINNRLATTFQKKIFAAVVQSFQQVDNPLRLNNFATGLRELARVMLDDLAPQKNIEECDWYQPETNQVGQVIITRAQRVRYAVQAGLLIEFVEDTLQINVRETIREFTKLINQLSKFTHVEEATFGTDSDTADAMAQQALDIFIMLFQTIDDCRSAVQVEVEDSAKSALTDELFARTVEALDEIATHYSLNWAHLDELAVKTIGPDVITFSGSGSVDCELQYGSDGDVTRGDGLRVDDNYPLTCEFVADTADPLKLRVISLSVDNSSFYE